MADPAAEVQPTLAKVRHAITALIRTGMAADVAHDTFAGASYDHCQLYLRAQAEFAAMPRMTREGPILFKNGRGSVAVRRSIAGFKAFLEGREVHA